jgi:hypothetical protein
LFAQLRHPLAQLRQRQQSLLISLDQTIAAFLQSRLFASQFLFPFAQGIRVSRRFSTSIDFAFDQRRVVQQTNNLVPNERVQSILSNGAIGAYGPFQPAITIRSDATVIV